MRERECSLRLGIWQDSGIAGDVAANLATVSNATSVAARSGVELLVFPECFLTGYFNPARIEEVASQVDENVISSLRGIAAQNSVALLLGSYEARRNALYNAALLIDAFGESLATYRKRALYGAWEKSVFTSGKGSVLVNYGGIRIAVLICFDLEFPELARECAKNGADLIVVPTALMEPYDCVARHVVPARAFENQVYVAYANRTGHEFEIKYLGNSSVWDPNGKRVAQGTESGPELLTATVSRSVLDAARKDSRHLDEISKLGLD